MLKQVESDPTGRSPNQPGAKLDAGKAPTMRGAFQYFPRALTAVARVSKFGAEKYTWSGWEDVPDGINRYSDAMGRHITGERTDKIGDEILVIDPETGLYHAAQTAWNALARLELMIREEEKRLQDAA
jgi:hypothetical protein